MIEKELYPLSEAQQRIWVTQMLNPESSMFTIGGYMLIKGAVEIEKLQTSINHVIQKNKVFQTHIVKKSYPSCPSYRRCPEAYQGYFQDHPSYASAS